MTDALAKREPSWRRACPIEDLPPGSRKVAGGVTLFHLEDGRIFATENRCPHMGYPMIKGTVRDGVLTCAWHRWDFDLGTGGCYRGASDDLRVYPVKIEDRSVHVLLDEPHVDRDRLERQLAEAMLEADPYLQAKALARLLDAGAKVQELAEVAAEQAFRHALSAHMDETAAVELEMLVDALMLAEHLPERARVGVALQGVRMAGGPSGERAAVLPLPGPPMVLEQARPLLLRYAEESSALAIERLLLSLEAHVSPEQREAVLLEASTLPCFLPLPQVLLHVAGVLRASRWIGTDGATRREAALLAWILGQERPVPEPEGREGQRWLEENLARIDGLAEGDGPCSPEQLEAALDPTSPASCLGGLLRLLEEGAGPTALLDSFSVLAARRFGRLWVNNGGLWGSASLGLRLCSAIREVGAEGVARRRGLFVLGFSWYSTRWLQPGRAVTLPGGPAIPPSAEDWHAFEAAFSKMELTEARKILLDLASRHHAMQSPFELVGNLARILLEEDQSATQLRSLMAALGEHLRTGEPAPYLLGVLTWAADRKLSREVGSAARFGRTWLHGEDEGA